MGRDKFTQEMKIPVRPMRLIREFCEVRFIAYHDMDSAWRMPSVFYSGSTRYELVTESKVILRHDKAPGHGTLRLNPHPPVVVYLDHPPPYRMGKVDEEHALTLSVVDDNLAERRVIAAVWRISREGKDLDVWEKLTTLSKATPDRWDAYSVHRQGISIMSNTAQSRHPVKVCEWNWREHRVDWADRFSGSAVSGEFTLDKIRGYAYHSGIGQFRNTRFLGAEFVVDLEYVLTTDLGGNTDEMYVVLGESNHTGTGTGLVRSLPHQRIPIREFPSAIISPWFKSGTTHILDWNPEHRPIYFQLCDSVGFTILDIPNRKMRHFPFSKMIVPASVPHRQREWWHLLGGDDVAKVSVPDFSQVWWSSPWYSTVIEIDGREDWIRIAVFGAYDSGIVVHIDMVNWTCMLLGTFVLKDRMKHPVGLVRYQDPHVDELQNLNL